MSPGPGASGRNGIEIFKVDGVSVENLTVRDFCKQLERAGRLRARLRQQHVRLGLLRRRLSGLQHRAGPCARSEQRARLLGIERRRPSGAAELRVGSQSSRNRSQRAGHLPNKLQDPSVAGVCGQPWNPNSKQEFELTAELGCASVGLCTGVPGPGYPPRTQVKLFPIPHEEGMENPCEAVPANSWCPQ